ncbi:hypothetical protein ACCAA_130088 [Candidatus Accumulibacter aalborgensis]|uniref:Uncharacterized protein n=1 Tax=Candidatus Accumulibacter aalborgensis TaxID=1860102 RepID=A0A1A8XG27_9PROT|nr:hypothetical protein ACCAA_130088 [Candidatus Accumulibacter aalborgensis]
MCATERPAYGGAQTAQWARNRIRDRGMAALEYAAICQERQAGRANAADPFLANGHDGQGIPTVIVTPLKHLHQEM